LREAAFARDLFNPKELWVIESSACVALATAVQDAGAFTVTSDGAKRLGVRQPSGALGRAMMIEQLPASCVRKRCRTALATAVQDTLARWPGAIHGRSATVSAGPVAAGGGAEAVENILWRGFAGGRAPAPAAGLCHSRAPTATRLQQSAQRWSKATTLGERAKGKQL
jgi:hypothetical protein